MPTRLSAPRGLGIALAILGFGFTANADTEIRQVTRGSSSLTFNEHRLASVGLAVTRLQPAAPDEGPSSAVQTRLTFAAGDDPITFRVRNHGFAGFVGEVTLSHRGGFVLEVEGASLRSRTALVDFALVPDQEEQLLARIGGSEGSAPLEVRNAGFAFDAATGELVVRGGDLVVAADWARAIGRPRLAGELIGAFDLRLGSELVRREANGDEARGRRSGEPVIDVLLREVYGITDYGRIGTYPDGKLGLSFATTSCNNGNVDVPWHAPMAEDHPFIGLAMFREMDGRVEMIGKSWTKHGFFALANNQCQLGCAGGGGGYLIVGCSDTYSVANNASQFYLGPREEVNPHTGVWHCLGSYFDGTPVDCVRDEFGSGLNPVEHRLEVFEDDLGIPGAHYYYEGVYYVADDDTLFNNFGWRECTTSWNGSGWDFTDVGGGLLANPGPFLASWGQVRHTEQVASDDGYVILSETPTDLGDGNWHYEWALYNQTSARAIDAFTVPVGDAVISNAGFRDIDRDGGNEWAFSVVDGSATWETIPFGEPGTSNPLEYQCVYNFWFDANCAPIASSALLRLHRPGVGSYALVDVNSPNAATGVLAGASRNAVTLYPSEPNPFVESTRISFALDGAGPVRLYVTDVTGRIVRSLLDGVAPAGRTGLRWDGRNDAGTRVASGIYFFRLESSGESRTAKGILLR